MLYGIINGEKRRAQPNLKAICPLCGTELTAKCGAIKVWHWAHTLGNYCDEWTEGETKWHKNWKEYFGIEQVEVVVEKRHKKHIADIVSKNGVVIEVQHSPIKAQVIEAREDFLWTNDLGGRCPFFQGKLQGSLSGFCIEAIEGRSASSMEKQTHHY